jgi:chloramphenicol O-acetyltransferase
VLKNCRPEDDFLVSLRGESRTIRGMAEYLDLEKWARQEVFEFFRGFDKPYFNISTTVDVSKMLAALRHQPHVSGSLSTLV